jgi:hypothetical protein
MRNKRGGDRDFSDRYWSRTVVNSDGCPFVFFLNRRHLVLNLFPFPITLAE